MAPKQAELVRFLVERVVVHDAIFLTQKDLCDRSRRHIAYPVRRLQFRGDLTGDLWCGARRRRSACGCHDLRQRLRRIRHMRMGARSFGCADGCNSISLLLSMRRFGRYSRKPVTSDARVAQARERVGLMVPPHISAFATQRWVV